MKINMAHIRERSTGGGWINFAVFDARSKSGSETDNAELLADLTRRARASGLKVDQSALAFTESRRVKFYGSKKLVDHLSRVGVPKWTHTFDP
ncbi:MAG: hypothetical protein WD942_11940 [Dehalococcoidia bacterium]